MKAMRPKIETILLLNVLCLMFAGAKGAMQQSGQLRVLSYNVRYDSMPDSITVQETIDSLPSAIPQDPSKYYPNTTEQPWSTRRIHIANEILLNNIDVYGMTIHSHL